MTERRDGDLPVGPLVAALGALLLVVSLFLPWYEVELEAFTVFEFLDLLLLALGLGTVVLVATGLGGLRPAPSPALVLALGLLTFLIVVSQVLNDPPAVVGDGRGKEIGIWLALAGAALMAAGAVLAFARISIAVEARTRPSAEQPAEDEHDAPTVARPADPEAPSSPDRPA